MVTDWEKEQAVEELEAMLVILTSDDWTWKSKPTQVGECCLMYVVGSDVETIDQLVTEPLAFRALAWACAEHKYHVWTHGTNEGPGGLVYDMQLGQAVVRVNDHQMLHELEAIVATRRALEIAREVEVV